MNNSLGDVDDDEWTPEQKAHYEKIWDEWPEEILRIYAHAVQSKTHLLPIPVGWVEEAREKYPKYFKEKNGDFDPLLDRDYRELSCIYLEDDGRYYSSVKMSRDKIIEHLKRIDQGEQKQTGI